jgi:hypothetical protein
MLSKTVIYFLPMVTSLVLLKRHGLGRARNARSSFCDNGEPVVEGKYTLLNFGKTSKV